MKKLFKTCIILCTFLLCSLTALASDQPDATKMKSGWNTVSGQRYYKAADGELSKDTMEQIGKYTYAFDQDGKMITGTVKKANKTYTFSKKTGRLVSVAYDLKVTKTGKSWIIAKNKKSGDCFRIDATKKLYGKNDKKIKFSRLKKGDKIRVYTDTTPIREVYPALFGKIKKICLR